MASQAPAKAALRKEIAEKLKNLAIEEQQKQSKKVLEKLINLPAFQNSKRVSVYLSIPGEVDTEPIVKKIFEDKKECFVPRYSKVGMEMVKLKSMEDWMTLPVTNWGIKQPKLSEPRDDALKTGGLDLILAPGVAFTANGLRLGHGGGYYDKFLNGLRKTQEVAPSVVGLALNEQIVDDLPTTETDVKLDLVLYANSQ